MKRAASLYLPNLSIERIRKTAAHAPPDPVFVTARKEGSRMLVDAVSPEALALGFHPGMPLAKARSMMAGLDVRDSDPAADSALLERLALYAARRWTPRAAVAGADGIFLDLTGCAHLFGGEEAMARRILGFCRRIGLTARIAIAGTFGAAHALARHGSEEIAIRPSCGFDFLASFPIEALRVDENALGAARRLGLETVGELLGIPRGPLRRRFGASLLTRLDQALGRAGEAIEPVVPEAPPFALLGFAEPIASAEAIECAVRDLVGRIVAALERGALGARRLLLSCLRIDGKAEEVSIGTARATRDSAHLARLLCATIATIEPGFGIEAMRLTATRVEPLAPEQLSGGKAPPDLAPLVDRLAGRLGERRLFRMSAVESDVPERCARPVGPFGRTEGWPDWPRPVRLLDPPERVENVVALLPDQPPRRFSWRGRSHSIARADGPERLFGEWWKHAAEADAVRDYFEVEDEEGARFWLYRRGDGSNPLTGDMSWYLHGVFG
jgi:protein ImuB